MPDPYVSVIREPALLTYLLSRQMIWVGSEQIQTRSELADQARLRFHHFRFLVGVTATLINQQLATKHWNFNRQQLQNVNLLPKFLHCLLEMIQEPAKFPDFFMEQGSPESPQAIADLWHFIFLSHPANNTYIDHMVVGHCEWINPAFIKDEPEGDLQGESQLSKKLNKILRTVGKDAFLEKWRHGQTLFDIRREYEEMAKRRAEGLEDNVLENRDSSPSGSGLVEISDVSSNVATPIPDLLSDIPSTSRLISGSVFEKPDTNEKSDSQDSGLDDLRHFSESQSPEKRKKDKQQQLQWIVTLRAGLMQVMSDVLQNGTDSLLAAIRHDVISWQAIVVLLSHQTDIRIREAALDMLEKFMIRNQPVSSRMADSLFSLMCNETVRLGDGLDGAHLSEMEVDKLSCESFNSIFILYEESVPDVALFWNVNNALLKTFENHWQLQQAMLDCKLVDTMVNTLRRIAYLEQSSESDVVAEKPFASLQLECWSSFAQRIVIMAIPYHEPRLYESCQRFIYLLMLADIQASRDDQYPLNQRLSAHKIIRSQLCQLLHCWLESVRTVFSEEGRSASASSSVDSLYNQNNASSTSLSSDNDYEYIEDNPITPERAGLLDGIAPSSSFVMNSYSNLKEIIKKMGPISRRALQCPYPKRQVGSSSLEAVEILNQRMLLALEMNARIFTILTPTAGQVTEEEENLFHFFLYFMLSSWKKEVGGPVAGRAKNQSRAVHQTVWQLLIQMCRDKVRVFLAQLVAFVLFPAPKKIYETSRAAGHCKPVLNWDSPWVEEKRRQIVRALAHELQYKQNLATLLNVNLDYEYALCLGLYELAFLSPLTGSGEAEEEIDRMIRFLSNSRVGRAVDSLSPNALQNLTTDEILAVHSYSEYRKEVTAQMRSKMEVIIDEEGKATAKVSQMAMSVTCEVVEEQNFPRKAFIKATKSELQQFMEAEKILKNLADELCHPEAPGFEERHWPIGWALDPTEGPMRERKRMMPYYYSFDAKFFMPEKGEKVAKNREEQPLEKLLIPLNDSTSPLEHVQIDEPTRLYLEATVLRGTFECKGELVFGERHLHFVGDKAKTAQVRKFNDLLNVPLL
ncbi:hypothetical protein WR25_08545 [Diploscapter pachys]|uniref:BEACH-type PH domain-containing protein n=1 Tax=Diploscapter pachys TaxID=2018661 RepID=A0A2A2K533_9BILA|nr:hypothetical protein WR25_08545 [Diploscapter pachys]